MNFPVSATTTLNFSETSARHDAHPSRPPRATSSKAHQCHLTPPPSTTSASPRASPPTCARPCGHQPPRRFGRLALQRAPPAPAQAQGGLQPRPASARPVCRPHRSAGHTGLSATPLMLPYRPYHTIPHRRCSPHRRTLHWVTKIGSLKNSLRFYELVRHRMHRAACSATVAAGRQPYVPYVPRTVAPQPYPTTLPLTRCWGCACCGTRSSRAAARPLATDRTATLTLTPTSTLTPTPTSTLTLP